MKKISMDKHCIQKLGTAILAATMAAGMIPAQILAAENDENPTEKTETIYTVLNPDGTISSTIVSAWLHDDDGLHNVKEDLDLTNVENVKGDDQPTVSGKTYTWNTSAKDIWYQGDSTKELPVTVKVDYTLDGKKISAEDLAGKSGKLDITIHFTNNVSRTVTLNGKQVKIHPSFLAGGMIDMDAENCKNVKCAQGKIVSDGNNEFLAFAAVPGLAETMDSAGLADMARDLDISDDIRISADVTDYDPSSLMMAMTNDLDLEQIPQLGSISELTGGVRQLYDASLQLEDGSRQLYDGTSQLKAGIEPLGSALPQISQLDEAATQMHAGTSQLKAGIQAYTEGESALAAGTKQLYGITDGISQVQDKVAGTDGSVTTLKQGSESLAAGLKQLKGSVDAMDAAGINDLLAGAQTQLETMSQTVAKDKQILAGMQTSMEQASAALEQLDPQLEQFQAAAGDIQPQVESIMKTVMTDNQKIEASSASLEAAKSDMTAQIDTAISALTAAKTALTDAAAATNASSTQAAQATNDSIQSAVDAANAVLPDDQKVAVSATAQASQAAADTAAIDAQIAALEAVKEKVANVASLDDLEAIDPSGLQKDLTQIQSSLTAVSQALTPMAQQLSQAAGSLDTLQKDLETSIAQVEGMQQQIAKADLPENIDALKQGVAQLSAGADALNTGVGSLELGLDQLHNQSETALDKVNAGADQLSANNEALVSGITQLDEGTAQLESKKGELNELSSGLSSLTSAVDQLNAGAKTLYEGNEEFVNTGTKQLNDKVGAAAGELEVFEQLASDVRDLNADYAVFSGAPEGAKTKTMYVFRTREDTVKKDDTADQSKTAKK